MDSTVLSLPKRSASAPTEGTIFTGPPIAWERRIETLTPVHDNGNGQFYKREDWFAPLGYGGANGSKLRQLILLIQRAAAQGARGVLTAASVHSPQVPMTALVARYYGLRCTVILGGTQRASALKHRGVRLAAEMGADLRFIPVGYNPALQRELASLAASEDFCGWFSLPYAISLPANAKPLDALRFHAPGSFQIGNIPSSVHTIVLPFGSGNSTATVLFGLAKYNTSVGRVLLVGIGPNRLRWLHDRLALLSAASGLDVAGRYWRTYAGDPALADQQNGPGSAGGRIALHHISLHELGLFQYGKPLPLRYDGIDFHPTYEGHVMHWLLSTLRREWHEPGALFWIVGSEWSREDAQ